MERVEHPPPATTNCANCGETMRREDKWCASCGQKVYQGPPTVWRLLGDFLDTVFSLDNRLFRTIGALMVPGRLTNYFLGGRQKPFFHPLRLFFVSGVLLVATYSFYTAQAVGESLDRSMEQRRALAYNHQFGEALRVGVDSIQVAFPEEIVRMASDSLLQILGYDSVASNDSMFIGYFKHTGGLNFTATELVLSNDDQQILPPTEIVEKYGVEGAINQYQVKQVVRLNRLGLSGLTALMGQLIWGLVLLVPLSAAWLKLFYLRRQHKYVEHFIFTLHTHAFIFITQFFAALELLIFSSNWLLLLSITVTAGYFLLALKRVYRQSWPKTLVKACLLSVGYLLLVPLALSITAVIAVLVF